MVNSVNSMSAQTYDPWKRLTAIKENNKQDNLISTSAGQVDETSDHHHGRRGILMKDLMAIMQSSQKPDIAAASTTTTDTATEAITADQSSLTTNQAQSGTDISGIDADGDGTISPDEYNTLINKLGLQHAPTSDEFFKKFDANSDGEISLDELKTAFTIRKPMEAQQSDSDASNMLNYDTDGDGALSKAEYEAAMSGQSGVLSADDFFAKVDTNADGKISVDEFGAALSASQPHMRHLQGDIQAIPSDIDTDKDGKVSQDEYDTLVSQMGVNDALSAGDFFQKYDTNSDGEISPDEIIAGLKSAINNATTDNQTDENTSAQNVTDQSLSADYQKRIEKMLNAYETNYEYMFGNGNSEKDNIA